MMKNVVGGLLLLLAGASGYQVATPVDKVISLLTKLSAQVQSEGVAEAASYDKYACFCKDQADDKVYVIAKSDKRIKELDADITALTGEITSLDDDVKKAKEDVKGEEKTQKDNQEARNKGQATYDEKRKSLAEAVEAVESALETMRNSRDDVQNEVASLLQKLPQGPQLALIADATAGKRYGKPGDAAAYQYASKDVIATLTSLTATFKKELQDLDKAEMNAVSDFEMAAGARSNTITALNKEINEKETLSASKGEEKSDKDEQKNEETKARNADQAFLDDLTLKCEEKAKAWDKRSTTRAAELTALQQGVELLKGMGDLYSTNSKLVGFIQLRSVHSQSAVMQRLTGHLSKEAHSLSSAPLAMLALQLKTLGPDHFVKVRGLIKDLISKLEADAKADPIADAMGLNVTVPKMPSNMESLDNITQLIMKRGNLTKDKAKSLAPIVQQLEARLDHLEYKEKNAEMTQAEFAKREKKVTNKAMETKVGDREAKKAKMLMKYLKRKTQRAYKKKVSEWKAEKKALHDAINAIYVGKVDKLQAAMARLNEVHSPNQQEFLH